MGTNRALIIVDVQNDFCEGGSLAVEGGADVAARIAEYVDRSVLADAYDDVVFTKDWHIQPKGHFASFTGEDEPNFMTTWPDHCVAGTGGADFHDNLLPILNRSDLFLPTFYKGMTTAAYSGFEGIRIGDLGEFQTLDQYLREAGVNKVDIVGIALDYCVKATALDAVKYGYETSVLTEMTVPVAVETGNEAVGELHDAGVST